MADLLFHPDAQDEYDGAFAWYQSRSPQAAARFEAEVDRSLGLIKNSPEMFANYDDGRRFAVLRRFPYSIVYQVQAGRVFVIALAHSSRSPGYWQGRA